MLIALLACTPPTPLTVDVEVAAMAAPAALWSWESTDAGAELGGGTIARTGDLDADGYDDVAIGAPGAGGTGEVYVFLGGAGGLAATPDLTLTGVAAGDRFGAAVAGAGDVNGDFYDDLVIGAPGYDGDLVDEGAVWVFLGSRRGLATTAVWTAEGDQEGAALGTAVAGGGDLSGDRRTDIAASAPYWTNGEIEEGGVWVWHGSAAGVDTTASFSVEGGQTGAHLSTVLVTNVDESDRADLVVGAPDYDAAAAVDAGAVWAWPGGTGGVDTSAWTVTLTGREAGRRLGGRLCAAGDRDLAIDAEVHAGTGRGPNPFAEAPADLLLADAPEDAVSVCGAGDVDANGADDLVASWSSFAPDGGDPMGAAWVLRSEDGEWEPDSATIGTVADEGLGTNALGFGDVNGDGFDDVLITSPGTGVVTLVYGAAVQPVATLATTIEGGEAGGHLGYTVANAGDVNHDGYEDVLIGAPDESGAGGDVGRAHLHLGGPDGLAPTPVWTAEGEHPSGSFGSAVANVGDLDGDGWDEIAVGAPGLSDVAGRVEVFRGRPTGLAATPTWVYDGVVGNGLGVAVAGAGDVNGDGYDDLAVGAHGWGARSGRVAVLHGSPSGPPRAPSWARSGGAYGMELGTSLLGADVNGDGFSDLVVGDPARIVDGDRRGAIHLFLGSPSGLATTPSWSGFGNEHTTGAGIGDSLVSVGDLDGDGYVDLVTGASESSGYEGYARLYRGSALGLMLEAWEYTPAPGYWGFGQSVAACDVNADGATDLLASYDFDARVDVFEGITILRLDDETWAVDTPFGDRPAVTCADVDGDGAGEIVVGERSAGDGNVGTVTVWERQEP